MVFSLDIKFRTNDEINMIMDFDRFFAPKFEYLENFAQTSRNHEVMNELWRSPHMGVHTFPNFRCAK